MQAKKCFIMEQKFVSYWNNFVTLIKFKLLFMIFKSKVLIIDDDKDVLLSARVALRKHFDEVFLETSIKTATTVIRNNSIDVALLDMNFRAGETSGKEGLDMLQKIKKYSPETSVIMITAYGDIELAVEAMKLGATDFIVKPWENAKLLATVKSACQLSRSRKEVVQLKSRQEQLIEYMDDPYKEIIGKSKAIKHIFETIDKVASTDANILILGENGTGKELFARAIHKKSERSKEAFIHVDLGSIAETLFESELFGHKKGAFTDAKEDKIGRFEVANNGTLFLDEIGNLSSGLQSKMLSVIQNKEIIPVGSNDVRPINIRLVSATNANLHEMIGKQKFRQDLLYRINTVEIKIPPLRERKEDIPLLSSYFLNMFNRKYQKQDLVLSGSAEKKLMNYSWPGNIRELQHVMERAVILSSGKTIEADAIYIQSETVANLNILTNIEDLEKAAIVKAIQNNHGNLSKAAQELGLGRTTLYRKMQKYDIQ
jgi:two-component system, NtrC family, response regulator HydG